jgi:hypothetical protein
LMVLQHKSNNLAIQPHCKIWFLLVSSYTCEVEKHETHYGL